MTKSIEEEIREKIKRLHEVSFKMESISSEEQVFDTIIDAAKNILDFYVCSIDLIVDENNFEVKRTIGGKNKEGDKYPVKGIAGETFRNNKSYIENDVQDSDVADPLRSSYKSVISIPIGDMGIFQAISDKPNDFDKNDLELAELLITHLTETLKRIKNEKKLIESEKRYRGIFDNKGTAKIILDEDMVINKVSKGFEEFSGYNSKELESHVKFKNFLFGDDYDTLKNFIEKIRDTDDDHLKKFDLKFIDKFGNVKDTIGAISYIPESKEFNLSLLDVTDFKNALQELRRMEKGYQTIFENSGIPMLIVRKDSIIDKVNSKFVEVFGYHKGDIQEKKSWTELVLDDYVPMMKKYHLKRRSDPASVPSSYKCNVYDSNGDIRRVLLEVGMIPKTEESLVSVIDLTDRDVDDGGIHKSVFESDIGGCIFDNEGEIVEKNNKFLDLFDIAEDDTQGIKYLETPLSNFKEKIRSLLDGDINSFIEQTEIKKSEGKIFKIDMNCSVLKKGNEKYILCLINEY